MATLIDPKIRAAGVIVYPPIRLGEWGGYCISYNECNEKLSFFLSYFDKIMIPKLSLGVSFLSEKAQLLAKQNIVTYFPSRKLFIDRPDMMSLYDDIQHIYRHSNINLGGGWAISPPTDFINEVVTDDVNSLLLQLTNFLPSPAPDIPFHEIIDFRMQNIEKLNRLHFALDSMFVANLGNAELYAQQLKNAVEEVEESYRNHKFPFWKVDVSLSKSLEAGLASAIGEAIGSMTGLPPLLGSFIGGSVQILTRGSSNAKLGNSYPITFEYVYQGRSQNILSNGREILNYELDVVNLSPVNSTFEIGCGVEVVLPEGSGDFSSAAMQSNYFSYD